VVKVPIYEQKVLKNGTKEKIEFMCGGRIYEVEPDEERLFDGFVAYHALHQVNTGLTEVIQEDSTKKEEVGFSGMSWQGLLKEAGRYAWFKTGMNRQEIEEALKNEERSREEAKKAGVTPSPKKTTGAK